MLQKAEALAIKVRSILSNSTSGLVQAFRTSMTSGSRCTKELRVRTTPSTGSVVLKLPQTRSYRLKVKQDFSERIFILKRKRSGDALLLSTKKPSTSDYRTMKISGPK